MCILYTNQEFGSENHFTDHKINLVFFSKHDIIFQILKPNFDINTIFFKVCNLLMDQNPFLKKWMVNDEKLAKSD